MNRIQFLKIATVCCPLLATTVGAAVIGWEMRRERRLKTEYIQMDGQAKSLEQTIKGMSGLARSQRFATVPATSQEQPEFLKELRGCADARHVQLVRWSDTPDPTSAATTTPDKPTRPVGVSAVVSQLDARGNYNDTRLFLYDLLRSPRLFTLNDVKCTRGEHGLTLLNLSVTRYITAAPSSGSK